MERGAFLHKKVFTLSAFYSCLQKQIPTGSIVPVGIPETIGI